VRIYETVIQNQQAKLSLKGGFEVEDPCLSVGWCEDDLTKLFGGCVNGLVKAFDINSGKSFNVGKHDASVKSCYYLPKTNLLLSLSFDKTMRLWDLRTQQAAVVLDLGLKVYCSDLLLPYLAIGGSHEKLVLIDLDNIQSFQKGGPGYFESTVGKESQITCVSFLPDGAGLGVGSNDGRVNVSKFANDYNKIKLSSLISFKTKNYDQSVPQNKHILYPVHDIGFHHLNKGSIFTAGGEGAINFWDFHKKSRYTSYEFQGVPVTRAKMSPDGALLAYALGYDWSLGIHGVGAWNTKICVHAIQEADLVGAKH